MLLFKSTDLVPRPVHLLYSGNTDYLLSIAAKIKCVPLVTEPDISLIILPLVKILQRNLKRTTDTFLFISHTTNLLLLKFRDNIFFGVRIIKEMPGSVASRTHCIRKHSWLLLVSQYGVGLPLRPQFVSVSFSRRLKYTEQMQLPLKYVALLPTPAISSSWRLQAPRHQAPNEGLRTNC